MKYFFPILILFVAFIFKLLIVDPQVSLHIKLIDVGIHFMKIVSGIGTDNFSRKLLNLMIFKPPLKGAFTNYYTFNATSLNDSFPIKLEIYTDSRFTKDGTKLPTIIYLHGGGWVLPGFQMFYPLFIDKGFIFIEVDYRLAPEYKVPIGLEDCYSAVYFIVNNLHKDELKYVDKDNIILMGDSAGGNLSAILSILIRDRGQIIKIREQVLLYPSIPIYEILLSKAQYYDWYIIDFGSAIWFIKSYINQFEDLFLETVTPYNTLDLTNLPDTYVIIAERDFIRSENIKYIEKLKKYSNKVEYKIYDSEHGFFGVLNETKEALNDLLIYFQSKGIYYNN